MKKKSEKGGWNQKKKKGIISIFQKRNSSDKDSTKKGEALIEKEGEISSEEQVEKSSSLKKTPTKNGKRGGRSSSSSSFSSEVSSLSPPDDFDSVLNEEEKSMLSKMDVIPNNYYLAFTHHDEEDDEEGNVPSSPPQINKDIIELNQRIQHRLVEEMLNKKKNSNKKKRKGKIRVRSQSEERRRKRLIMKQFKRNSKRLFQDQKQQQSSSSSSSNKENNNDNSSSSSSSSSNDGESPSRPHQKESDEKMRQYNRHRELFLQKAAEIWKRKIIPNFSKLKTSRQTIQLWKKGLPPIVRGEIWELSISSLSNTSIELYNILKMQRLEEKTNRVRETMELIELDLVRTFPQLQFFQSNGPYYEPFLEVLECWVKFRPDIGYIQGMSYLVGMLMLHLEPYPTFKVLSTLLTSSEFHFYRIFSMKLEEMENFSLVLKLLMKEKLIELYDHFEREEINLEVFVIDWFMTLFSKSFPIDIATHLWDLYLIPSSKGGGTLFLYKATLGILLYYFPKLIQLSYDELMQFLSHISEHVTDNDKLELLKSISLIKLSRKSFHRIQKLARQQQQEKEEKQLKQNQQNQ